MSQGKRMPLFSSRLYRTMGAESLVSHPSTTTWKNTMMA